MGRQLAVEALRHRGKAMVKSWHVPLFCLIFLALNFLWLPALPWNDVTRHPFYLRDYKGDVIGISITQYIDYGVRAVPYLIIICLLIKFVPRLRVELKAAFLIWLGWFFDYFISFNDPLRHSIVFGVSIPVSYSFLMAMGLVIWFGYDYLTDNKNG